MTTSTLIERLQAGERSNELDIAIEVALFKPCTVNKAIRMNSAGTKVIYTRRAGYEETFWAFDWSTNPDLAIDKLRAIT